MAELNVGMTGQVFQVLASSNTRVGCGVLEERTLVGSWLSMVAVTRGGFAVTIAVGADVGGVEQAGSRVKRIKMERDSFCRTVYLQAS
jgi:hypothetical protein